MYLLKIDFKKKILKYKKIHTVMIPNKAIVFATSAFELIFIYLKLYIFRFRIWKYLGEFFINLFIDEIEHIVSEIK